MLTPPGAPTPTMKRLDEIEPRANLQGTPAPAGVDTTNANYHFIITQPGSYYLSANLGVTKTNGILINAEGVALDLNGFQISRASGSGGDGIDIAAASHRASVRNGSLKGFNKGVESLFSGGEAKACSFRDLAVSACTDTGINAGPGAVLESCRAHDNSGSYGLTALGGSTFENCSALNNTTFNGGIAASLASTLINCSSYFNTGTYGIYANGASTLINCSAYGNTTSYGIYANFGSTLTNCSAYSNNSSAAIWGGPGATLNHCGAYGNFSNLGTSSGIQANDGCTVVACSASANNTFGTTTNTTGIGILAGIGCTIKDCTVKGNTGDGIHTGDRCEIVTCVSDQNGSGATGSGITGGIRVRVRNCVADENRFDGISVNGDSTIIENHASHNGRGATAAGIRTTSGSSSRVEGNQVRDNNGTGILGSTADVIVRNTAGGNTVNFNPSSGANFGAIQSPDTATNPLANIAF